MIKGIICRRKKKVVRCQKIFLDNAGFPCYYIQALRRNLIVPYRGIEQLVARRAHNPEVGGSSPPPATIKKHRFGGVFSQIGACS